MQTQFLILSILLARLIRKVMPSQMAGPIIRALSFFINQLEQARKQTFQLMAGLQQRFQYRLTAHTSEHAEQQQKNKSRY